VRFFVCAQFRKKQVLQEVCAMVASLREAVDRYSVYLLY
jgi:hypothetical protein